MKRWFTYLFLVGMMVASGATMACQQQTPPQTEIEEEINEEETLIVPDAPQEAATPAPMTEPVPPAQGEM